MTHPSESAIITEAEMHAASEWAWRLANEIVMGRQGVGNAAVLIDRALARRIEAEAVPDARARIAELEAALARQGENMAFALNNFEMPDQWYCKFTRELEEERRTLKGSTNADA